MDDVDPSSQSNPPSETLKTLTNGALASSLSTLTSSSKTLPSSKDFHFFNNFPEFKFPVKHMAEKSQSLLCKIGESSRQVLGKSIPFDDEDGDDDVGYDWVVNVNDEVYERFDVSNDELKSAREGGKEGVGNVTDGGFQLVYGKRKSKAFGGVERNVGAGSSGGGGKVGLRDKKGRVQFHISSIRKPQEEFNILVNNSNEPFQHVWLERSVDGLGFIHPLEKLSVVDFVDKDIGDLIPVEPPSIEDAPFKLVEEVKDLKKLAAKLRAASEFAVDLEHNQYRSFQGLTCLMQISTRTEDFIVDTLKLRIHVGPHLREVFKDPTKKKVMHGADRDIIWLQRDFGIYVCNLFDTGQASRILKLERNSLEHLLHYFCGVTANKEYQNADWRLRPLPDEMLRYAREDTHYLLYIYDLMRLKLFSMPKESVDADAPLVEVYKRSYDICMQLYEKEILTEDSYLYTYCLQGAQLNAQQLAIVAGLYEWRDAVARSEDESTGYILPNKSLIEIAKQMPVTTSQLRWSIKSKHPYVERNLSSVVSIIRHSMQNAAAFESIAERLKDQHAEAASKRKMAINDAGKPNGTSDHKGQALELVPELDLVKKGTCLSKFTDNNEKVEDCDQSKPKLGSSRNCVPEPIKDKNVNQATVQMTKDTGATIQVQKKPSGAFGALLGNSASKRKLHSGKKDKGDFKLEQIRSSVNLQFHLFDGGHKQEEGSTKELTRVSDVPDAERAVAPSKLEDIIIIEDDEDEEKSVQGDLQTTNEVGEDNSRGPSFEMDKEDEPVSLNELSSSFQKCFQSINHTRKSKQVDKSQDSKSVLQIKPFDYEAAVKNIHYGDSIKTRAKKTGDADSGSRRKASTQGGAQIDDTNEFRQGKRRQAFPASGNRSATFR